jgi:hypothetical protein
MSDGDLRPEGAGGNAGVTLCVVMMSHIIVMIHIMIMTGI